MSGLGFAENLDGYMDVSDDLAQHVYRRTDDQLAAWQQRRDALTDPDVAGYQEAVRAAVLDGIGGLPPRPDGPPSVQWSGPVDHPRSDAVQIERLVLESLDGVRVTAVLYRPAAADRALSRSLPGVLFVCGHGPLGKGYPRYQTVCTQLAAAGMVVLTFDPFGQGERLGYLEPDGAEAVAGGTIEHTYAGIQCWWSGLSPARYFVTDAMRALDLLVSLPEVDPDRLGITGNSGGGTLCSLMMALEPRLAAAAPGTYITSRGHYLRTGQHQDAEQVLLGGTARGVDHDDLLAVMAPRPVQVLAADYDFFPIEGTLASVERARRIYALAGDADQLRLCRAPVTHSYAPPLAAAAIDFFTEVFGLDAAAPLEMSDDDAPDPQRLWSTESGHTALDRPGTRFIHDLAREDYTARIEARSPDVDVPAWVHERVRRARRVPTMPGLRRLPGPDGTEHLFWRSETDLWGAGVLLADRAGDAETDPALTIVLLHQGTSELTDENAAGLQRAAAQIATGPVLVLDVRGSGALAPRDRAGRHPSDQASTMYKLLCDLLWLDDSLAAGRAFDVTRAADVLLADQEIALRHPGLRPSSDVHLIGVGLGSQPAMLAGIIDPRVRTVTVDEVIDTDAIATERYYDDGAGGWQGVIPGLAVVAPTASLCSALGGRLRVVPGAGR